MIILQQLTTNELNIELVPQYTTSYWYFQFTMDDLNGTTVATEIVPDYISTRFYTFTFDTTANPMKTGEWVLEVYELENSGDPITGLTPSYVSKVRIYKTIADDNYFTRTLTDGRFD